MTNDTDFTMDRDLAYSASIRYAEKRWFSMNSFRAGMDRRQFAADWIAGLTGAEAAWSNSHDSE